MCYAYAIFQAYNLSNVQEFNHAITIECIKNTTEEFFGNDCNEYISARDENDRSLYVIYGTMIILFVLPFIYMYFWALVWSLRKCILQSTVVPLYKNTTTRGFLIMK